MCELEEWDGMLDGFNNSWGVLNKSGESSVSVS